LITRAKVVRQALAAELLVADDSDGCMLLTVELDGSEAVASLDEVFANSKRF